MKTAEEFLNDKFNGKGYEFKIHDWINGQVSNYSPCELLEEYAQQNTLNRDKVMEKWLGRKIKICDELGGLEKEKVAFIQCLRELRTISHSPLPTLSEGEMYDKALLKYPRTTLYDEGKREGYIAALKELTKPKEER